MNDLNPETNSYTESTQSVSDIGSSRAKVSKHDLVVNMGDGKEKKAMATMRTCCKCFGLLCFVIVMSFVSSFLTTYYFSELPPITSLKRHSECRNCGSEEKLFGDNSKDCCKIDDRNVLPVPEKQVQQKATERIKAGAQVVANATLLRGHSPELKWTHKGSYTYLDGINHVPYRSYDCLEITVDDRYLITIQLTYRYTITKPPTSVNTYFTLVRFRDNEPHTIARSEYIIPTNSLRNSRNMVARTILYTDKLQKRDLVCVTVSHPKFIYASGIDNFFGIVTI